MSSDFHDPIVNGANADDTVVNAPLGQLDQVLFNIIEGDEPLLAVRIGNAALDASAIFQVVSTTQGFLPPRMTETQRNAIASPAEGLIVHNIDDDAPNYYNGSSWVNLFPFGSSMQPIIPVTALSSASSVLITDIPQSYQDLVLRLRLRAGGIGGTALLRFNNASGASDYAWAYSIVNTGFSGIVDSHDQADSEIQLSIPTGSDPAENFADFIIYIRNYTEAQKNYGDFEGASWNSAPSYAWGGFQFDKAEAITRIDVLPGTDVNNFNGSYALYGVGSS